MNFNSRNGGGSPSLAKELRNSKISVWWDYENCEFPKSAEDGLIVNNITAALMELDLCGLIIFSACGDVKKILVYISEVMNCTGITMINLPPGRCRVALEGQGKALILFSACTAFTGRTLSMEKVRRLLHNVSSLLRPGGYSLV